MRVKSTRDANDPECAERALWLAVVQQAFVDAMNDKRSKEAAREAEKARLWLLRGSGDFRVACSLAGLEPGAVRDKAVQLSQHDWQRIRLLEAAE